MTAFSRLALILKLCIIATAAATQQIDNNIFATVAALSFATRSLAEANALPALLAGTLAAAQPTSLSTVVLTKRDHPPDGIGGYPSFAPRPTDDNPPCWHGGVSRASCMFGTYPRSTSIPSVTTVFFLPPSSLTTTYKPTIFDPKYPFKKTTTTVFQPPVTITVTADPISEPEPTLITETAIWTETISWTEDITWIEPLKADTSKARPSSEPLNESEQMVKRSEILGANMSQLTDSFSKSLSQSAPVFTTVARLEARTTLVARTVDQTCRKACTWDADYVACKESCNKDLMSFTRAGCKDYAPSCMADKDSELCKVDCASLVPGNDVCATGCFKAENPMECEASCDRDLHAFRTQICQEHTQVCLDDVEGELCRIQCDRNAMAERDEGTTPRAWPKNGVDESKEEKEVDGIVSKSWPPWGSWSCAIGIIFDPDCQGDN